MNFRSPPPHKRSSGHKGGASEFERTQKAIQRTVERLGWEKLPLNDEIYRESLQELWEFAKAHGTTIMAIGDDAHPDRIYHGLASEDPFEMKRWSDELADEMINNGAGFTVEDIKRIYKPVLTIGKMSFMYFENIWTPVSMLDGRKH